MSGGAFTQDVDIELPLEGHDQVGKLIKSSPPPGLKLRVLRGHVDFCVATHEAHHEPFLLLSVPAPAPCPSSEIGRQVVDEPAFHLVEDVDVIGADLLA